MSEIIQPFGRVIQRITIEVDHNEQVKIQAENLMLAANPITGSNAVQMDGITLAKILSGILHSTMTQIAAMVARGIKAQNGEKTS